jgi:hypothetical protein
MLCVIISEIFTSRAPINVELFLVDSVGETMAFTMPYAVELSVRRGVGGCVWPNSVSVTLSGAPLWELWKHAPTYDSAAEATTFLITAAMLRIDPISVSGKRHRYGRAISCRRRDIGLWHPGGLLSNPTFDLWRLACSPPPWFVPLQCH